MKTISVKTSELEGAALDAAIMKALGMPLWDAAHAKYSTSWHLGGPLIEDRVYKLEQTGTHTWTAWLTDMQSAEWRFSSGSTPLIAAMRAIVASELGDTVDIPEELEK